MSDRSGAGGSLLVTGIGSLITNDQDRGGLLGIVSGAAVAIVDGTIAWVGSEGEVPTAFASLPERRCDGGVALPGFVDAHTHAVFAGDRAEEFARRVEGASYEELLASGGGIHATVAATRRASLDELIDASMPRLGRMLASGTTTAEVKTGYGLDVATERKILDAILAIDRQLRIELVPTFLGAHVIPLEYRDDRTAYVDLVVGDMLTAVAADVRFVDVFCDDAAFTVDETRRISDAAAAAGLGVRLHVDQLSHSGGAALAAEIGAVAADHLDHSTDADLAALAGRGVVAVLLPGVAFSMREPGPPARRMWDTGVTVAIATDCNPGTSNIETMPFVVALAVANSGLTVDEAVWAATRGGALALALQDRGAIVAGLVGDLIVLDAGHHADLAYRPDSLNVAAVIKRGVVL